MTRRLPYDPRRVHLAGPIRPFAVCGSYHAGERHSKDKVEVNCLSCIEWIYTNTTPKE
jgi:hypothetical protein